MNTQQKCEALVDLGRASVPCQRPATQEFDGRHLCGPHAAGRRRSAQALDESERAWNEKQAADGRTLRRAEDLGIRLGIDARPEYIGWKSRSSEFPSYDPTMVVVPVEWLERLADERDDAREEARR